MLDSLLNDAQLWNAITDDDSRAFAALYDRYRYGIYMIAFSYLKDSQASEEIVHDIFFDIWKRRKFLKIDTFKHYFSVAARNRAYKMIRKAKNGRVIYIADYGNESAHCIENMGYERIKQGDLEFLLNGHLKKLPQRCEEIFVLSRLRYLTNHEIANLLGISKRTVENQLTTASKYLRGALQLSA